VNEEDRGLLRMAVAAVSDLTAELGEFRGEMREFKAATLDRVKRLEEKDDRRQADPESCVTGRALTIHLRDHGHGARNRMSVIGLVIALLSLCGSILIAIFRGVNGG